jgi:hypothetical protein
MFDRERGLTMRFLLEDVSCKYWIFNLKGNAIKVRLDAMVAEELAQQQLQLARGGSHAPAGAARQPGSGGEGAGRSARARGRERAC